MEKKFKEKEKKKGGRERGKKKRGDILLSFTEVCGSQVQNNLDSGYTRE